MYTNTPSRGWSRLRLMKRPLVAVLVSSGVLVAGVGFALLSGGPARTAQHAAQPSNAIPSTALSVEVVTPVQMTMPQRVPASGSFAARDELLIGSDASAVRWVAVHVDVGAKVRRGQVLALGDDTVLRAQLAQQEAALRQASAQWEQARANLERAELVKDSGVYSAEALQTRRNESEGAAARVALIKAQRAEMEARVAQTRVLAPADGVIARRSVSVGAVSQPGNEMFRLIRNGEVEWQAEVPDHVLRTIRPGAVVRLSLTDGEPFNGVVRLVAPTVDPGTRNGTVHVTLPAEARFKPGGHGQGSIEIGQAKAWTLPEQVILSRDGSPFVFVVDDAGLATVHKLRLGDRLGGRVEVFGLAPGALVIATGAGFVKDGETVRVVRADARSQP